MKCATFDRRVLYNLHLLRVIAALGVVYFHTTSTAGLKLDWDVGSRGVDVFFVISGFIIAYIGSGKPEHFFRRRLIRIVPFYWAATLCVFAVAAVAPHIFRTTTANVPHLLSSLAFIPRLNTTTGEMMPTLLLGWSLNFEMFFYVLFALSLRISPHRAPLITVGWIVAFVLAIHAIASNNDVMNFYARPIVLEFCFGVGVYFIFQWCSERKDALAKLPLKIPLVIVFVGGLVALACIEEYWKDVPRWTSAGIPSFFIVLSALLLERIYGLATKNKLIYLLGESSYIIYLVHPYIVFSVLRLAIKDADLPVPALVGVILALLALTSAISVAIHVWFEKPVMAFLRKRFA
jgi:peptidoglycan/LPS O-acetylase OafA/YrhL